MIPSPCKATFSLTLSEDVVRHARRFTNNIRQRKRSARCIHRALEAESARSNLPKRCKPEKPEDIRFESSSWHGSHAAGTIAATTNNRIGVSWIDWNARLLPIRVLAACGGFDYDVTDGIYWAAGGKAVPGTESHRYPAKILNLSLGGEGSCSDADREAIDHALAENAVAVVAADSEKRDASVTSPASCKGVITVAAPDKNSDLTSYGNFGSVGRNRRTGGRQGPTL